MRWNRPIIRPHLQSLLKLQLYCIALWFEQLCTSFKMISLQATIQENCELTAISTLRDLKLSVMWVPKIRSNFFSHIWKKGLFHSCKLYWIWFLITQKITEVNTDFYRSYISNQPNMVWSQILVLTVHWPKRNLPMSQGPSVTIANLFLVPSLCFASHFSNSTKTSGNSGATSTCSYKINTL